MTKFIIMKPNPIKPLLLFVALAGLSFIGMQQERTYSVSGTIQQWQGTLEVIEQSQAPHVQVKSVQAFIIGQINAQLKRDSLKADSARVKK